ncbi:MAG: hypothetical protein ACE5JU_24510, partial [Candidatus Binatia bacterium]
HAAGYYLYRLWQDKGLRRKVYRIKSLISSIAYLVTGRKYFRDTFQLYSRVETFLSANGIRIVRRETDYYGRLPAFHRILGRLVSAEFGEDGGSLLLADSRPPPP